jgi:hypothetical protein
VQDISAAADLSLWSLCEEEMMTLSRLALSSGVCLPQINDPSPVTDWGVGVIIELNDNDEGGGAHLLSPSHQHQR